MSYIGVPKSNNRYVGSSYEALTVKYLKDIGYTILETNYRCRSGEIDIIAQDQEYIVFIEVKYRKTKNYGYPRESVNFYKQKHILSVAKYYLFRHKLINKNCRFDVVEILGGQITHIKNAFIEG